MTAHQLWVIGFVGPLGGYLVIGVVIALAVGLPALGERRIPAAAALPRAWLRRGGWPGDDDGGVTAWLAVGVLVGWVLVISNAIVGMAIDVPSSVVDRVALAGMLAGLACGPALRGFGRRPVVAAVLPFAWNVLALWAVAY